MRRILLGLCLLGGALSLGSSPALAQVAASTVVLSGTSGNTCVYTGITMQPNGGISVTCSGGAATAPGAPTIGVATALDASINITFAAPGSNGGAAITSYTATCASSDGGATNTGTGAASPITVSGLTNTKLYTCTVTATNSAGPGAASAASNAVTPTAGAVASPPGAPTIGTATAGNASIGVAFTAPASNGGAAITAYNASCTSSDGGTAGTGTNTASPITVSSLTNGKTYTCTVTATNSAGPGAASAASNAVSPTAPVPPGAPTGVTATPGNGSLSVAFTAPASNGGAAITAYNASCSSSDGGAPGTGTNTASPITVSGLDNGKTYTCTVTATNSAGTSGPSTASGTAVPVAGCGTAPVGTTVVTWTGYSNPGNTVETGTIATGASKAYKFTANSTLYPIGSQFQIETSTQTGGSNRADIAIATCPGVFTSPQAACVMTNMKLVSKLTTFDPLATSECLLQNGQEYYVNFRPNAAYSNVAKVLGAQGR